MRMKTMKRIHTGNFCLIIAGSRPRLLRSFTPEQKEDLEPLSLRKTSPAVSFCAEWAENAGAGAAASWTAASSAAFGTPGRAKAPEGGAVQNLAAANRFNRRYPANPQACSHCDKKIFPSPPADKHGPDFLAAGVARSVASETSPLASERPAISAASTG